MYSAGVRPLTVKSVIIDSQARMDTRNLFSVF
jgi:hypothetical protein